MTDDMGSFRLLKRRMTWDMIAHELMYTADTQRDFGLAPASKDVLDMEHRESENRLYALAPVNLRIRELSGIASGVAHRAMLNFLGADLSADESAALVETMTTALVVGVVSTLLAEGRISLNSEGHSYV